MPRRQRQRDELRELCRSGALARAIDLAFQHFADFGRDETVLDLLATAIERLGAPDDVRRRFENLRRAKSAAVQRDASAQAQGGPRNEGTEKETGT